jgi:hypothetical protein
MFSKRKSESYPASNNKKWKGGKIVAISGHIEALIYPSARELYDGFAVVRINGQKVVGKFPFLDFYFTYHVKCERQSSYHGTEYHIVEFAEPPFEPFPLTCFILSAMLVKVLGYQKARADREIAKLKQRLRDMDVSLTDLKPYWLMSALNPLPQWLITLSHASLVFKHTHILQLRHIWSFDELSKLSVTDLARVSDILPDEIFNFCFHWKNEFNLPELTPQKARHCEQFYNRTLDPDEYAAVATYYNFKIWLEEHNQLSVPPEVIKKWPYNAPFCMKHKIITIKYTEYRGNPLTRYFLYPDICLIQECMTRINALFDIPTLATKRLSKDVDNLDILNAEQRACYEAIFSQNFIIILGDAGTGKTLVGSYIYRTYRRSKVLPVAYFGKVAANLKDVYGNGMTIHKLSSEILHNTDRGKKIKDFAEILIIDEGSTLTLELLNTALKALPKLKKVILLGDEKQMPPPSRGAVFDALVEHYIGTPAVHRLHEVQRTYDPSGILKRNFDKIIAGQTDLEIGLDLNSEHPFVLLHRIEITKTDRALTRTNQRVEKLQTNLRPVLQYYEDGIIYHIITQKNDVRQDLNQAVFRENRPQTTYHFNTFFPGEKIMFRENDYGTGTGKTRQPKHIASSAVMNGEVVEIRRIVDLNPNSEPATARAKAVEVNSTSAAKQSENWHRMLILTDGRQVNLWHYRISKIVKGTVTTIASMIGSETEVIVLYVHDNFSRYMTRKILYTALTRARRRVVVICAFDDQNPQDSDLRKIILNNPEPPECVFGYWLHKWRQAPIQAEDPEGSSEQ